MGFFNKVFGGDEGIREAMYETYGKLKGIHTDLKDHEVLGLTLASRYRAMPPQYTLLVAALYPSIIQLTEWVVGLENSGLGRKKFAWPNAVFESHLSSTSTVEEREQAFNFVQNNMSDALDPQKRIIKETVFRIADKLLEEAWDIMDDNPGYVIDDATRELIKKYVPVDIDIPDGASWKVLFLTLVCSLGGDDVRLDVNTRTSEDLEMVGKALEEYFDSIFENPPEWLTPENVI